MGNNLVVSQNCWVKNCRFSSILRTVLLTFASCSKQGPQQVIGKGGCVGQDQELLGGAFHTLLCCGRGLGPGLSEPLLSVSATGDWWSYRVQFHTQKSWPWCSYTWLYLEQELKDT